MSNHFKSSHSEPVLLLKNNGHTFGVNHQFNNNNQVNNQNEHTNGLFKRNQTYQHFGTITAAQLSQLSAYYSNPQYHTSSNVLSSPLTYSNYFTAHYQRNSPKENSILNHYTQSQYQLGSVKTVSPNQQSFCIRFAVNGLSKFSKGNTVPSINKNIQAGILNFWKKIYLIFRIVEYFQR